MDFDTEDLWITEPLDRQEPLHRDLRTFDATLRCEICGDFYHNPVSLNACQHSFCSECIRNSLTEQSTRVRQGGPTCPSCRVPLDGRNHESNYRPNRTLAHVVAAFAALRQPLHQALVQTNHGETTRDAIAGGDSLPNESQRRGTKRPASSGATATTQLEPKRRLIYNNRKRKELQELCHKEGLSTAGTEQQLKERHQRFVVFWNSHTDNLDGCCKTDQEIKQEFNDKERERECLAAQRNRDRGALDQIYQMAQAEESPSGGGGAKTSARAMKLSGKMNDTFQRMIAEIKNRQKPKKESDEDSQSSDTKVEAVDEQPETASSVKLKANGQAVLSSDAKVEAVEQQEPVRSTVHNPTPAIEPQPRHADNTPNEDETENLNSVSPDSVSESVEGSRTRKLVSSADETGNSDDVALIGHDDEPEQSTPRAPSPPSMSPKTFRRRMREKRFGRMRPTAPRSRGPSLTGPWSCPACTFYNKTRYWSTAKCEVCDTLRPKPNAVR